MFLLLWDSDCVISLDFKWVVDFDREYLNYINSMIFLFREYFSSQSKKYSLEAKTKRKIGEGDRWSTRAHSVDLCFFYRVQSNVDTSSVITHSWNRFWFSFFSLSLAAVVEQYKCSVRSCFSFPTILSGAHFSLFNNDKREIGFFLWDSSNETVLNRSNLIVFEISGKFLYNIRINICDAMMVFRIEKKRYRISRYLIIRETH